MHKKINLNNKIYDVIDREEFVEKQDIYFGDPSIAIQCNGYVYPVYYDPNKNKGVGLYQQEANEVFVKYIQPISECDQNMYSEENIIDFGNAETIKQMLESNQALMDIRNELMTGSNDICKPPILNDDEPEMRCLKEAIICKNIDLDAYQHRIGPTYGNDRRLLKKPSITLKKLRSLCDSLDMKLELTISDASPDIPNPIGKVLKMDLTGGVSKDEE